MAMNYLIKLIPILCLITILVGCSPPAACPVTDPKWALSPEDVAVNNPPAYGYYFINEDRSIWASAWWFDQNENFLISGKALKTGWFRPEGVTLEITGQRLDGEAPALEVSIPCCYPTRFQATGLTFPTDGCWQVNAAAGGSHLSFIVQVKP